LYALLLLLLTVPLVLVGWLKWSAPDGTWRWDLSPQQVLELFTAWGYWLWLAVFVTAQALLLLVPVNVAERRPTRRRHLLFPIVVSTFLLANLFLAGVFAILSAALGDNASVVFEFPAELSARAAATCPA